MKNVIWEKRYLFVKPTKMIWPNKFCQPSATEDWQAKIKRIIEDAFFNGHSIGISRISAMRIVRL